MNEKLDGLINVAVLRKAFSISDVQLNALKAAKIVEPTVQRARARSAWDPTKIESFLSKLTEKSTDISRDDQSWEHIHDAAVRCRLTIGIVVAAVLKGDVAVGIDHKRKGYAAVHVVPEKVDALAKEHFPEGQSPFVFGQALGIVTKGTMQALIDSGLMEATVILDPKSGKSRHRVTAADADAFHAKFLTLRTAAAEVVEPKRVIKALIEASEVEEVSTAHQSFDGIYLRQDVESYALRNRNRKLNLQKTTARKGDGVIFGKGML
ncbi:hypothetical protein LGQ03_07370 [Loktanella sp. TSTF-M6]|uniref:Uncharacterized protein n=1 Tax=Loktanella gaetbuli TaxID=2881335 RepID=A0ABS8BU94_9RHOB|nr:hypothetical protein [Loktanella gaetbuli]MCB5199056.1 hypothetical protein [Loktanella gaetbuli]